MTAIDLIRLHRIDSFLNRHKARANQPISQHEYSLWAWDSTLLASWTRPTPAHRVLRGLRGPSIARM